MLNLSQNKIGTVQALESLPALVALNLGELSVASLSYVMDVLPSKRGWEGASLNL